MFFSGLIGSILNSVFSETRRQNCGVQTGCGKPKYGRRRKKPGNINRAENEARKNINNPRDYYSSGPENDSQNSADNRVILVKRLEKMPEGDFKGQYFVQPLQKRNENMPEMPRAVYVPMMEKIEQPVEKTVDQVN